jgi:flagellar assembly protein FliH
MALGNGNTNVKPYKFGELVPSENETTQNTDQVSKFEMKSLKDAANFKNNITDNVIRTERGFEKDSAFSILPLVREHRGIVDQEQRDYEEAIQNEVDRRLKALYEETRQQAYQEGHQEGYQVAYSEAINTINDRVEDFVDVMNQVKEQVDQVVETNKQDAIHMIKNLTKWITLKELDDDDYLVRLLNKLILEMNAKNNLLIRVNQDSFKYMPEVIEKVQAKVGELTNVRVEIDLDLEEKGIILESENGIIDASLDAQFKSLDKIFEAVSTDG